ncbi:LysR family transcriptional regulator [Sinomonas cellulolyticus]|uniref:LysR family transcriptional regulator n=1 Tax=Sinomonas cellulolyticus TaxID=2801916 RepID=A0ABS1K683_9MICC|nr:MULTISPECIES: LysR family transcriptional regulator [Sinomonas]MBL0707019.1 LysR family transcriptional regulator [Sinomonas cellulolyticus]GHG54230.1 LysR family transcriptional regulator [Sinomonas sp. KCTC 49339]
MIQADDLRFFLEVARTGRLVAAARALGVEHTTVGRRVSQLERAAGTRLFDRTPGGWELTEAGQALLVHAEAIESSLLAASEELGSARGRLSGTLRIAAPDGFGAFVLSPGLGPLRTDYPDLTVEVVTETRLSLLATREFDIGIALEEPTTRGVRSRPLARYGLSFYASPDYLSRRGRPAGLADLASHPMIGYVDALLDIPALRFLDEALPGVRPAVQTNNVTGQWMAAIAGLGIAVLPDFIASEDGRLVRILEEKTMERTYWIAVPSEHQRLARTRAAESALVELVRAHRHLRAA